MRVLVGGVSESELLIKNGRKTNACGSTFSYKINAGLGDDMELSFTVVSPPGYTDYRVQFSNENVKKIISTGYKFDCTGKDYVFVTLNNTNSVETLSLTLTCENESKLTDYDETISIQSTGSPCV